MWKTAEGVERMMGHRDSTNATQATEGSMCLLEAATFLEFMAFNLQAINMAMINLSSYIIPAQFSLDL